MNPSLKPAYGRFLTGTPGAMRHAPPPPKTPRELAPFIDHTLLRPDATEAQIETLCREAIENRFFSVCVNGGHVARAAAVLRGSGVKVAVVVGFPLGAMASRAKAFEAELAVREGASEIDMVLRIDLVKSSEFNRVRDDIVDVVKAAGGNCVKVILETGLLTLEEIVRACRASDEAGAHFVKTCTGFSTSGGTPAGEATVEHIALMKESIAADMQVKASGGVRSFEKARALILAGADRIGTSSGVSLVSSTGEPVRPGSY